MNEVLHSYLVPPGAGVYTVNTAKERKQNIHQLLYKTHQPKEVASLFKQHLEGIVSIPQDKLALLGVCSDTGGGILRGANWGPLFIREQLYQSRVGEKLIDLGDTRVIPHLLHDKYLNHATIASCQRALYGHANELAVSPLSIAEATLDLLYQDIESFRLLALGGDHSVSYPLVKSYLRAKTNKKIGLIHFDAHTDLLRERLGIDLCFGSWLTHVLPFFEQPSDVIQIGIRSSGKPKSHWENEFGIKQYWSSEVVECGMEQVIDECVSIFQQKKIEEIYISFDIDALDSRFASATGTPEPGGLTLEDACLAITSLGEHFSVTGADLVEVAPFVQSMTEVPEPQTTLHSAKCISEHLIDAMLRGS